MGLRSTPCSARNTARAGPCSVAAPHCDRPMQTEVVTTKSTSSVAMTGPAPASPNSARMSGTPMKPELGNAATKAPMAASGQPAPRARACQAAAAMTTAPHNSHSAATAGSNRRWGGVLLPNRNSMHGSAKYSTKMFSPGTASSGSRRARAAK